MSKAGASLATCYGPVSADVIAKAENIRLLILDVDGVLSDGRNRSQATHLLCSLLFILESLHYACTQ